MAEDEYYFAGSSTQESRVFAGLKSCCLELLEFLQNPKKQSPALFRLLELIRSSPSDSLQHLFEYTLFPLLLLLDSAIECRSRSQKDDPKEKLSVSNPPKGPLRIGDAIAEGVVQCLNELLEKCHLSSVDQMAIVMKKLTYGAMLSPFEASEEFREGTIKCFRALISNLHPCLDESCSCSKSLYRPILEGSNNLEYAATLVQKYDSLSGECLLAFLQSQRTSAAVGHWLSLLLNAADAEANRGHRGSAKLRVEAFLTFRTLVAKVGSADALAFFLPGVVSKLTKVLHVSKSMLSGAAGSTEATEHAIRGLAEFLIIVLQDSNYDTSRSNSNGNDLDSDRTPQSFLEELHHLHIRSPNQSQTQRKDSSIFGNCAITSKLSYDGNTNVELGDKGTFHVNRTEDWIGKTSAHVTRLLSSTFPQLSLHPSTRVRRGVMASIQGLLQKCRYTLKESRLMLLECSCCLVFDDSEEVSSAAQEFIESLFVSSGINIVESDVAEICSRLLEKLPKTVLGSDKSSALAHAQQLLGVMFYSGPHFIVNHLLFSPIKAARTLDVFAVCMSQESVFAGSVDKLIQQRPSSTRYLHSIIELKSGENMISSEQTALTSAASQEFSPNTKPKFDKVVYTEYTFPRIPPWLIHVGSEKLYLPLARILRLIALSSITDPHSDISFTSLVEVPLCHMRNLVSDIRMKQCTNESWKSWYARTGSGHLVRQASSAVCMLNEMVFGLSDQAVDDVVSVFHKSRGRNGVAGKSNWKTCWESGFQHHLSDCVRVIFHEYITPEIWDLPVEHKSALSQAYNDEAFDFHVFQDVAVLQQVIIDGIGIFCLCLGKDFASSGFLHSSLYLLLENLICSNSEVRHASDAVLQIIAKITEYSTVGHLVVANADYIIDSICRQLRHLDLNPHIPNVLAAVLSYIGMADKILPLLEEPMRSISLELEILSRHRHPELTTPFLKAVAEIAKAAKHEAGLLPAQAKSLMLDVSAKLVNLKKKVRKETEVDSDHSWDDAAYYKVDTNFSEPEKEGGYVEVNYEEMEMIWLRLNDRKRYRRMVASIASSCLTAVTPLLSSAKEAECLVALDIVEHGMATLSEVEEAFRHEKETKETLKEVASLCSFYHLEDTLDSAEEGTDENRLLPAANKIWPFLVTCVQNRIPLCVRRCSAVVTSVVQLCGGDFFSRRFYNDGSHFWKLLTTSPFHKKPILPKEERNRLLLPYRSTSLTLEDPVSETSNLKVQASLLNMIADLSRDKRSRSALEVVLKKASGLVVGITCSGVRGLRDASINALLGLASMDPDLIWLLVADVYYSQKRKVTKDLPAGPTPEFPELDEILPAPRSSKDFLYAQYGGQTYGFDIDFSAVEAVFWRLNSQTSDL